MLLKQKLGALQLSGTLIRGEDHKKCDFMHIFRYITDVLEIETISILTYLGKSACSM